MIQLILTAVFICLGPALAESAGITARASSVGDTVHIEFAGQNQWKYDVTRSEAKGQTLIKIQVPKMNEGSLLQLKNYKLPPVKEVTVDRTGPDGSDVVTFVLTGTHFDLFDYLTDQPSRLIVDLFPETKDKKAPIVQNLETPAVEKTQKKTTSQVTEKNDNSRKPASDTLVINKNSQGPLIGAETDNTVNPTNPTQSGIFDGGDPNFTRFSIKDYELKESAMIAAKEKIYIKFPMLRIEIPTFQQLITKQPIYEIVPKDTDENKQARLLLTLFKNKRYNVFAKTIEWFLQKYPKSEYDEIVRFMWADSLFSAWLEKRNPRDFDLAILRYHQMLEMYPETPLAERTSLLIGFATLDRGDYLGAIRLLQAHIKNRPQSPNKDVVRLALAEAFLKLNRYDDALAAYGDLEKNGDQDKYKKQATFMRGDVYYQKKDYQKAVEEYKSSISRYPAESLEFPNAFYNQAESYFWLEKYKDSLAGYVEFLKKFPSHPFAGYAMTRAGELLENLGADRTRVMGAYLETYFRYGETPSSIVARLRMLSSRMKGMKPKEVEKAVSEISELAQKSDLPKIEEFATLMIAEGFSHRGEYDKSIDLLVKYYQTHPTTADTELLSNRIVRNINDKLRGLVDSGNFIEALRTHNKYTDSWLRTSDRVDTKYNVARAFEQAGVLQESEKLYRDTLNKIMSLKGTRAEKERNIFEQLPSTDEINLRLASVETQNGKYSLAYDYLKQIDKPDLLSEAEQIERVHLVATIMDKRGEPEVATRYLLELIKTWKGQPELVSEPFLFLGQLEQKMGKIEDAIKSYQKVDELMEDSGKVAAPTHAKVLETLGNIYFEKGEKLKAKTYYEKLLSKYENSRPLASIRYRVGQIHFEKGEIQKAADIWQELKNGKSAEFWYKLAQEQLRSSDWKDEYKKYIRRIPAMSERPKQ